MGYLNRPEYEARLAKVTDLLAQNNLDLMLVYYDEFNIGNGWYLTGWCPQFESGAVLVPRQGEPMILGGPESEPFAKLDSTITNTRNFPVFMVPNEEYPNATIIDFPKLFQELNQKLGAVHRVGLVGAGRMPADCYRQIVEGFVGIELVDITEDYVRLRYDKSPWERDQIRHAFALADLSYDAMVGAIRPGASEISVAAAGEAVARGRGANAFGYGTIVGSGVRAQAVVPTASSKPLEAGELVMIGIAPKVNGYAGVMGDVLPVSGKYTSAQSECLKQLTETLLAVRELLRPGRVGHELYTSGRAVFERYDLLRYLVCPFAHTIGLHEAESPFFGPRSDDVLRPGMTVCIDVSFFGHPQFHGTRIETGYEITDAVPRPLSSKMDKLFEGRI